MLRIKGSTKNPLPRQATNRYYESYDVHTIGSHISTVGYFDYRIISP